jgi:3-oxoacyl-[acyl-carrier-protein] synthase II
MKKRVVITGLGALSAAGETAAALWDASIAGRSGVAPLDFASANGHAPIGAAVKNFVPEKFITQRKSLKVMARDIQFAVAAASQAIDDGGARALTADRERFGVIVGSGVLNHELDELAYSVQGSLGEDGRLDLKKFGEEGMRALFPLWLLKYLPNMPACHISVLFDLQGPNNTITTGPSAGLQAIGEAFRIIQRGSADLMVAGGAESKLNPLGYSHYKVRGVLADSNGCEPAKAYRPFDAASQGVVVGEGAAFVLLEEYEHAKKRGAKIYAEIASLGSSSAEGRASAMKAALAEAGLSPKDVTYLQACGTGLPQEDAAEADAIETVFQKDCAALSVSASKAVTGFTGFSSGAFDLILSTLALKHQTIPAVLNFEKSPRLTAFRFVQGGPLAKKIDYAMTNVSGLGGQSVTLVTKTEGAK